VRGKPPQRLQQAEREAFISQTQKKLKMAVTKTITAFLTLNGGTLLIGVDDGGTVVGIEGGLSYFLDR
jgi:predicted HTH transcriptional regulator